MSKIANSCPICDKVWRGIRLRKGSRFPFPSRTIVCRDLPIRVAFRVRRAFRLVSESAPCRLQVDAERL